MTQPGTPDTHPLCPTCLMPSLDRQKLDYFVSNDSAPPIEDDVARFHEETACLVRFLGALAQAGPLAVAFHFAGLEDARNDYTPEWVTDYTWLAEELTKETDRRLELLRRAERIWQKRAETTAKDESLTTDQ